MFDVTGRYVTGLLILLLCIAMLPMAARGELKLYEPFDGTVGDQLVNSPNWTSSDNRPLDYVYLEGNLEVPAGVNLKSPVGQRAGFRSDPENYVVSQIENLRHVFDGLEGAGTLYASYLAYHDVSPFGANEWHGLHMGEDGVGGSSTMYIGKRNPDQSFVLEVKSNGGNIRVTPFNEKQVYFIVVKFDWNRIPDDGIDNFAHATVWFNPDCNKNEADNAGAVKGSRSLLEGKVWGGDTLNFIELHSGSWNTTEPHNFDELAYDELRIGTTWADVTPGKAATPTIAPDGGSFQGQIEVTLDSPTDGATIRYTLNDTPVTETSTVYTGPIVLTDSATVRARAYKAGMDPSDEASAVFFDLPQVATPVIAPDGGTDDEPITVTVTCPTDGAAIRYTLDGSEPTETDTLYTGPFDIDAAGTLKARAFKDGMAASETASAVFEFVVANPTITPDGGSFVNGVDVMLACPTDGAEMWYTLDGAEPVQGEPALRYTGPVTVMESGVVKVKAFKDGFDSSAVVTSQPFEITLDTTAATPVITPDGGAFDDEVEVSIGCATPGATIRYTVNGLEPGEGATEYTGPMTLPCGATVKARAFREGMNPSATATATFDVTQTQPKTMTAATYYDKIKGCWLAEIIGNFTGLPHEHQYKQRYPTEPWRGTEQNWVSKGKFKFDGGRTNDLGEPVWRADDDTDIEWTGLVMMEDYGFDAISYGQIRQGWMSHINDRIWCANAKARSLMDGGMLPPDTGKQGINNYAGAIDAQLEIEIHAQIAPGMPTNAMQRVDYWARVTNDTYAVDCSKFYAVMAAESFFISDPNLLVERAKQHFDPDAYPGQEHRNVHYIATQVQQWYNQYPDWVDAVREVHTHFHAGSVWSNNNFACGLVAILYGEGDVKKTIKIACLAGYDADNQAATIGSIVGTIMGWSGMENLDLNDDGTALKDAIPMPSDGMDYHNWMSGKKVRDNMPEWVQLFRRDDLESLDPDDNICARIQAIAEENIVRRGGSVEGEGQNKVYTIVDGPFYPNYDPKASAPVVASSPQDVLCEEGQTVTLKAVIHGTYPLNLQWKRNGVDIPGENGLTCEVTVTGDDNGTEYACFASNIHGSATTDAAVITINVKGDFNGDGAVNGLDIPGFKAALADPAGWQASTGRDPNAIGDFNGDGTFNGLDIPGFKSALAGG